MYLDGNVARINDVYKGMGFNDAASFGLRRKAVAGHVELSHIAIYRATSDYKDVIKAIGDLYY